jgi:hypothetical protein
VAGVTSTKMRTPLQFGHTKCPALKNQPASSSLRSAVRTPTVNAGEKGIRFSRSRPGASDPERAPVDGDAVGTLQPYGALLKARVCFAVK